jgi:hypothetical protein
MPAGLNREPSQQDLEIARQLQSFQSQGVTSHEPSKPDANTQASPQSLAQLVADSQTIHPDQDSRDPQQQNSPSPYPPAAQFTPLPQQQQRTPQGSAGSNGQICRYAPIQSILKTD